MFLSLACAVLLAVGCWMAALEARVDEESEAGKVLIRVLLAALSTAAAGGAWYALAFVVLPAGGVGELLPLLLILSVSAFAALLIFLAVFGRR